MPTMLNSLISDEVTTVTGKVFKGDITPLVFEMFEESKDIPALIAYLNGGNTVDVNIDKSDTLVRKKSSNRLSTKEWLSNCEQL